MTPNEKHKLIDAYNDEFIKAGIQFSKGDYVTFFKQFRVKLDALVLTKKKVTQKDILNIANSIKIQDRNFVRQVYMSLMISAIANIIENQKIDKEDKKSLTPVLIVLGLYDIKKPKLVVSKLNKVTTVFLKGGVDTLNATEKKVYYQTSAYYRTNHSTIKKLIITNRNSIKKTNLKIKSNVSKEIIKSYKSLVKQRLTVPQIADKLQTKFGGVNTSRIERILDTELHTQAELTKNVHHLAMGYTHKKWKTSGDNRVRKTKFHNGVANKVVKIDKYFRAGGLKAMYAGDDRLPAGEKIRCRCETIYLKR